MKIIELFVKKFLLKLFLQFQLKKKHNRELLFTSSSNMLFIRLNRIGDALVITPLLHQIKKQIGARIVVLADTKNSFAFKNNKDIDQVIVFPKGLKEFFETVKLLNDMNFDVVTDLHDDISTTVSLLVSRLKIPFKFALEKENAVIYTHTVPKLPEVSTHVIERSLELSKLFSINIEPNESNVHYYPSKLSTNKIDEYIRKHFPSPKFLLGINISAGSDARFWGVRNYKKLISFLKPYDIDVVMLSATRDLRLAFAIMEEQKDKIFYTPVFDEFAAMVMKLDMLFSPDTATIHLASIVKIPVFGLYVQFDTDAQIWSPYQSPFDCVITKEPTLSNISFDDVINKFKLFLENHSNVTSYSKL